MSLDIQENYVKVEGLQILRESMNILIIKVAVASYTLLSVNQHPSNEKANNQLKNSH